MNSFLNWLPINDNVEAEFFYWAGELRAAVIKALTFALASGLAIALCPGVAGGTDGFAFVKNYWPHLVEISFWLGLLTGLLWSAGKRFGSAVAGSPPWREEVQCTDQENGARFFGQWGMFCAMAGTALWMAHEITAIATAGGPAAVLTSSLAPLWMACFLTAAVFLAYAHLRRRPMEKRPVLIRRR